MVVDYAINLFGRKTDRQRRPASGLRRTEELDTWCRGARMELNELQRHWDILGKEDPLWAIITWQDKKGNKWDPAAFFASGRQEIADVMQYLASLHLDGPRQRALDFGCGVGRLTRALADHFAKATGVDIAPSDDCSGPGVGPGAPMRIRPECPR
jgi:hypothetical protein